jgi:peptidoglycan-associated lipoprotein
MTPYTPFKSLVLGFSLLALAGCSSTSSDQNGMNGGAGSDSASSSGLGQEGSFDGKGSSNLEVGDQTYYFDFNKNIVRGEDRASIEVQGKHLTQNSRARILIEGHTDPRGSREYNIALGERRAYAVADILKMQGVSPSQIRIVSYGAEKLASNGTSDDDYQLDRRVNLIYESK